MKRFIPAIIVIGLVATICLWAFSHPVPSQRLQRLRKGMTREEVRAVLGEPTKTYGGQQWTYERPFVFGFVNIHWQADGTYDGEFNYERF